MIDAPYESAVLEWSGIRIEVRYCPCWLDFYERLYGHPLAHIEIESVAPENAPLPVTETGYRSHFTRPDIIEAAGGPAAFVRAWLDDAAKNPKWLAAEADRKQPSLF